MVMKKGVGVGVGVGRKGMWFRLGGKKGKANRRRIEG
jgi:hypothetical protein